MAGCSVAGIQKVTVREKRDPKRYSVTDRDGSNMRIIFAYSLWLYISLSTLSRNSERFLDRALLVPLHTQQQVDMLPEMEL